MKRRTLTKKEATRIAKIKHSKTTPKQKRLHALKMNRIRWAKLKVKK